MGKGRYIIGIIAGAAGIITGAVFWIINSDVYLFLAAYAVGAFVANIIWLNGPVLGITTFCIRVCTGVFAFFFGSTIGCLIFMCAPIAITICAGVITISLAAVSVISLVMFPINIFLIPRDMY
ncbi:MAG: hypothetical protein OSJ83_03755 [Clostridia bacterium]|nr:hypothetical protein [Clostridia bacterium]